MKIALGQINPTVGDFSGNSKKIIEFSAQAHSAGADLIIFPEMSVCGYPARDVVERSSFLQQSQEYVQKIAAATADISVVCGLVTPAPAGTGKCVMNSAAFLQHGRVEFVQSKMLLPTYDVFDEQRNFAPAKMQSVLPFADRKLALTICEDAWNDKHFWQHRLYSVDPVEELVRAGANVILNISASPFYTGKLQIREQMLFLWRPAPRAPVME